VTSNSPTAVELSLAWTWAHTWMKPAPEPASGTSTVTDGPGLDGSVP
jgi:hypothetical protein